MDEFSYPSATQTLSYNNILDSGDSFSTGRTMAADSTISELNTIGSSGQNNVDAGFATFVVQVAKLEKQLRDSGTLFVDSYGDSFVDRSKIGEGSSFRVEKVRWKPKYKFGDNGLQRRGGTVVLKTVVGGWENLLLEIRALLHPLLRYHPNIVSLLGLGWGSLADSTAVYPQLVVEYASQGTFRDLQASTSILPFCVKQKLCYDVGKGLSILHACGIIHGDIKHENVLIFTDKGTNDKTQPFIAKLADFGGAVVQTDGGHIPALIRLPTPTPKYSSPEASDEMSIDDAKSSDVFSFGILVCRAFLDGNLNLVHAGFGKSNPIADAALAAFKLSGALTGTAVECCKEYFLSNSIPKPPFEVVEYVLCHTLQRQKSSRSLKHAQAALRGVGLKDIEKFLEDVDVKNGKWSELAAKQPPGKHGITIDSVGFELGKSGGFYDAQSNLPGYRPTLEAPSEVDFLFEPERLKKILTWTQQQLMFEDFKACATQSAQSYGRIPKSKAAFYLFKCYLLGFGIYINAQEACEWLWIAGEEAMQGKEGDGGDDYRAAAWVWRISKALNVTLDIRPAQVLSALKWGIMRGYPTALEDAEQFKNTFSDQDARTRIQQIIDASIKVATYFMGAFGVACFSPLKLRIEFILHDTEKLDTQIREQLGIDYEKCLRKPPVSTEGHIQSHETTAETQIVETNISPLDLVFINDRGHGILHVAAARGDTAALRHLVSKYRVNIDILNQDCEETPLLCACRSGQLDASLFLLECGANPNGDKLGQEAPLHWLRSFTKEDEMGIIATKLLDAGANLEIPSGSMRADVRKVHADWEDLFSIRVTPLGRAVLLNNMKAVEILLRHGAKPLKQVQGISPIDLAAELSLLEMLRVLLDSLEGTADATCNIIDETELLKTAHGKQHLNSDTTSLLSRLVRHGPNFQVSLYKTLELLQKRRERLGTTSEIEGQALCLEIEMGNYDIVESLLRLGHNANGSYFCRPLISAIKSNHEYIFRLLQKNGAKIEEYPEYEGKTFLQMLAERPKTSRWGLGIANLLLDACIPVNYFSDGTRPAFASSLLNLDFELADLLLEKGANANITYQPSANGPWTTVLGELAQTPSENSLKSMRHLFFHGPNPLSENTAETTSIDFIVDKTNRLSILHILAACKSEAQSEINQLYSTITQFILSKFNTPEQINYTHPIFGTALCQAALTQNISMITELRRRGANTNICSYPRFFPYEKKVASKFIPYDNKGEPIWLALGCYLGHLNSIQKPEFDRLDDTTILKNAYQSIADIYESIINNLNYTNENMQAEEEYKVLQSRCEGLIKEIEMKWKIEIGTTDENTNSLPACFSSEAEVDLRDVETERRKRIRDFKGVLHFLRERELFGFISQADLQFMMNDSGIKDG